MNFFTLILVKHISLGINNIVFHCSNLFHCCNLLNFNSVMRLQILFNYFAFHRVHLFMTWDLSAYSCPFSRFCGLDIPHAVQHVHVSPELISHWQPDAYIQADTRAGVTVGYTNCFSLLLNASSSMMMLNTYIYLFTKL